MQESMGRGGVGGLEDKLGPWVKGLQLTGWYLSP